MALTIVTQPPALIMAYAPVKFTVHSDVTETPLNIAGALGGYLGGDMVQASAGAASFELSDWLQGLVTVRGFSSASAAKYNNVPYVMEFIFVEWYGDPYINHTPLTLSPFYILDGYIPKSRRKAFYSANASLQAYLVSSKACLTWWPDTEAKRMLPTQRDFLNFLNVTGSTVTAAMALTLQFTDGTTAVHGTIHSVSGLATMQMANFPTGYADLGLAAIMAGTYPTKTLAGYSVVVKSGSTAISKVYSYTLDTAYYQHPRFLWIRNAFGLWEVVPCTGLGSQESSVKPETAVTDGQTLADKLTWRTEQSDVVKVNTGFLTTAKMQWLSDMDFREAYEMIGSVLHPIVFRDLNFLTVNDGEYQYSGELEYEYAYTETTETSA